MLVFWLGESASALDTVRSEFVYSGIKGTWAKERNIELVHV
jgi:hypothetical protein